MVLRTAGERILLRGESRTTADHLRLDYFAVAFCVFAGRRGLYSGQI